MINKINNLQKGNYSIALAIIVVGVIIAGAIVYSGKSGDSQKEDELAKINPSAGSNQQAGGSEFEITGDDHVRGDINAPVTIIEFSDFECPFCQRFHSVVQQILDDYPGQVRWVYKHFPLDSIHAEARPAAEASECASEQGRFWEFADEVFENQSRMGTSLYKEIASQIGLDMSQFESCISSGKYRNHVESDLQEGVAAGVTGTPGSFINGEIIPGAVPYEQLKISVDQALSDLE